MKQFIARWAVFRRTPRGRRLVHVTETQTGTRARCNGWWVKFTGSGQSHHDPKIKAILRELYAMAIFGSLVRFRKLRRKRHHPDQLSFFFQPGTGLLLQPKRRRAPGRKPRENFANHKLQGSLFRH